MEVEWDKFGARCWESKLCADNADMLTGRAAMVWRGNRSPGTITWDDVALISRHPGPFRSAPKTTRSPANDKHSHAHTCSLGDKHTKSRGPFSSCRPCRPLPAGLSFPKASPSGPRQPAGRR